MRMEKLFTFKPLISKVNKHAMNDEEQENMDWYNQKKFTRNRRFKDIWAKMVEKEVVSIIFRHGVR